MLERNYRCRCGDARAVRSLTQVVRKFPPGLVGAEAGRTSTNVLYGHDNCFGLFAIAENSGKVEMRRYSLMVVVVLYLVRLV